MKKRQAITIALRVLALLAATLIVAVLFPRRTPNKVVAIPLMKTLRL